MVSTTCRCGTGAKVTRHRLMQALARRYSHYHWDTNVGYGTRAHQAGLAEHGLTAHHRRSFGPVSQLSFALTDEAIVLGATMSDVMAEVAQQ